MDESEESPPLNVLDMWVASLLALLPTERPQIPRSEGVSPLAPETVAPTLLLVFRDLVKGGHDVPRPLLNFIADGFSEILLPLGVHRFLEWDPAKNELHMNPGGWSPTSEDARDFRRRIAKAFHLDEPRKIRLAHEHEILQQSVLGKLIELERLQRASEVWLERRPTITQACKEVGRETGRSEQTVRNAWVGSPSEKAWNRIKAEHFGPPERGT